MADRVEDVHPGPGRLPPDIIVAAVRDARPGFRRWQRDHRAAAALVVAAALVIPALLFGHGWSQAQMVRGVGAGRGVLTVAACGDRKVTYSTDSDGNRTSSVSYTCTGTFRGGSATLDNVAVDSDFEYDAGVRTAAYVTGTDHVRLAENHLAAAYLAFWFTLACFAAVVEAAAIRQVYKRIRRGTWTDYGGQVFNTVVIGLTSLFVIAPALVLFWLISFVSLMGIYAL